MRKYILISIVNLAMSGHLFAAGIYENTNHSAEFLRMQRGAVIDVDAAFYNPAGTAFLDDGFYIYVSNQIIFDRSRTKDTSLTLAKFTADNEFNGKARAYIYPDVYFIYKQDRLALFFHGGIIGRGASSSFRNGLPGFQKAAYQYARNTVSSPPYSDTLVDYLFNAENEIKAFSFFVGPTIGAAYSVSPAVSLSLAGRYIYALGNSHLKVSFNYVTGVSNDVQFYASTGEFIPVEMETGSSGHCAGVIGGIDIKLHEIINIGIKFEYHTKLVLNNDHPKTFYGPPGFIFNPRYILYFQSFFGGYRKNTTLPMMASLGVSIQPVKPLSIDLGFTYYFNRLTDWGKDIYGRTESKKYNNGFDIGSSIELAVVERIRMSAGYTYSISGATKRSRNEGFKRLDAHAIGVGGTFGISDEMDLSLSVMYVPFIDAYKFNQYPDTGKQKYSEKTWNFALGLKVFIPEA